MRKFKVILASALLSVSMGITAFAGQWLQDATGWWYQNDDGTWPVGWAWIDGNNDGVAECYYFNDAGYCLMNTTTPDGCTVDANGAWTVNGVVQTQGAQAAPQIALTTSYTTASSNVSSSVSNRMSVESAETVWISATGSKFHRINNCGKMNPNKASQLSLSEAISLGYEQCDKCFY